MVLWEMFNCSCCFVVVKSCDSDFILCLHFSCLRKWKMKPLVLLVLVICTVVSMNLKLVSKRNSGKSQKNIFTCESGPSAHAIKHFICFLFCISTSCSLLEKKRKKKKSPNQCGLLTRCYRMYFLTVMFCWCDFKLLKNVLMFSFTKKTPQLKKNNKKKGWKPTKVIMTLALF